MMIYEGVKGLGARLGESFVHYQQRDMHADYLLVVHDPDSSVERLPKWSNDVHCKGVLFVRGVPFGGVKPKARREARATYRHKPNWLHFLSYSIGTGYLPFPERWQQFIHEVKENDRIDWRIIEPTWPENLVALVLLARSLDVLHRAGRAAELDQLVSQRETWEPILKAAQGEYKALTRKDLGFDTLPPQGAGALADQIQQALSEHLVTLATPEW